MRTAALVTRWVVRLGGLVQILLGVAFWSGHALSLIPVHMLIGLLVSIGLGVLAVLASRTGARPAVTVVGVAWALVLPAFGVMHVGLLPGPWHWVIRILHLALGLGALGFADRLGEQVLRGVATRGSSVTGLAGDGPVVASSRRRREEVAP